MMRNVKVLDKRLVAVTHADGTARVQTVDKTQNKTLNLQKNRPNVGLARRNQYWPAVRQLNVKNFTVKHRKQPHSCKINEIKLKFSMKSVKENKAGKRKTDDFSNAELFQVQISC